MRLPVLCFIKINVLCYSRMLCSSSHLFLTYETTEVARVVNYQSQKTESTCLEWNK